jgi:hypothetical protein
VQASGRKITSGGKEKYWILPRGQCFWREEPSEKNSAPHETDERKMNP